MNPTSLLTQPFHPPIDGDQYSTQSVYLENPQQQQQQQQQQLQQQQQQQQQQQYNDQEMLQDQLKYQICQGYNLDPNVYSGQSLDDNVIPNGPFPGDFTLSGYPNNDIDRMGEVPDFSGALFYSNLPSNDNSWIVDSTVSTPPTQLPLDQGEQNQSPLSVSPVQGSTHVSNSSTMSAYHNEQIPNRAQTPGPIPKSIPNYLTARRRSLSADNIHALAKAHGNTNRKVVASAQQPTPEPNSLERSFNRNLISPAVAFGHGSQFSSQHETMQNVINQNMLMQGNMAVDHHVALDNISDTQSIDSSNDELQTLQSMNEPINHAQRLNERQARFKVRLDKRSQRSMPNMQISNVGEFMNQPTAQSLKTMLSGRTSPATCGMEMPVSMSTPNTPTFAPEKSNAPVTMAAPTLLTPGNKLNQPQSRPRHGHTRKRSLSAPTQPFNLNPGQQMPNSIPLQPTQQYPFNISSVSSFRRPGAMPIQIQRSHKHSHASTPMSSEEYQRKLDEELEKIDFDDITVSELKDMLRQRGKPATGKKAVLMQRLQEEYELVKAMKNNQNANINAKNNSNNGSSNTGTNNSQYLSSPTSPSGASLHRSIANLHITSPPAHTRRFSPYGSVSIPSSPRLVPTGINNNRATPNYTNGGLPYGAGVDEWHFKNVGIVRHPSYGTQQPTQIEENTALSHSMMLMQQQQQQQQQHATPQPQQQQQQDYFGPSSAPATTTEFDAYQEQPQSAPATTTEFEAFQQPSSSTSALNTEYMNTYEFMRLDPMSSMGLAMGMSEEMIRMGDLNMATVNSADTMLLKQETTDNKQITTQSSVHGGLLSQGYPYEDPQQILVKPEFEFEQQQGFLPQLELQMQLEQQTQHEMSYSNEW